MWWDWTQITALDSFLFSITAIIILLFVGSGILRLICRVGKINNPFNSLDFIQKAILKIFLGFAAIIFSVFTASFLSIPFFFTIILVILIAVVGFLIYHPLLRTKFPKITVKNYKIIIYYLLIMAIVLGVLISCSNLIAGLYGSTNDDAADHTMMIRVIMDNSNALLTRSAQPYANFQLNYPSGSHVICAFFTILLNVPIQKIVLMVSAVLPALIALAFYFTLQCLFKNKYLTIIGSVVSGFFTVSVSWGPIGWGGLPVLASFYLSIMGLGLMYLFLFNDKVTVLNAALLGLVFFTALETYPISFLFTLFSLIVLLFLRAFKKRNITKISLRNRINGGRKIILFAAFLVPVLFSLPYLYVYYTNYASVIQPNVPLNPSTYQSVEMVKPRISFIWFLDIPSLTHFFSEFGLLCSLASFSLLLIVLFFVPKMTPKLRFSFPIEGLAYKLLFIYLIFIVLMVYLAITLFLPINLLCNLFDPQRIWQHIFILATILSATVIFSTLYLLHSLIKKILRDSKLKTFTRRMITCVLLALVIFSAFILVGFSVNEQQQLYKETQVKANKFHSFSQDDLFLMKWITENVPITDTILVSFGDSGQFLTAVTQRLTLSKYSLTQDYNDLMAILAANSSDPRAIPLLLEYNISYVYIGSNPTGLSSEVTYYRNFNSAQFLQTSYFTLTKTYGEAWLFRFDPSTALTEYNESIN
jgi:hypothetical protein